MPPAAPPPSGHEPVLLTEVLALLLPTPDPHGPPRVVVDCTLGRGGHARAMADRLRPDDLLIGLDADPRNLAFAQDRLAGVRCRCRLFHANFAELPDALAAADLPRVGSVHACLADLGISTNQLFDPAYGLSFAAPMALDMRLDPRTRRTAADWVNQTAEGPLADVLYNLADERYSRRIARKIVDARRTAPINTTDRLADLVRAAIPKRPGPPERIDPATRTFMALRMAVNDEVGNLSALLERGPAALTTGGRLAVISFHSVEDRLVKQAFRAAAAVGRAKVLTNRPVTPGEAELAANPRSRSAKLRAVERLSTA
jgi:16S rRNA (cytosine1402-N4)-methyltransferase